MIGILYRYPHPHSANKFLYCGQGEKRDKFHRKGISSFGRRFKLRFPDTELPQPIREEVQVSDQYELNELETIWMFQYHTWHHYPDGMNLAFPGSQDYKNAARMSGLANITSGHLERMRNLPQTKAGQSKNGAI